MSEQTLMMSRQFMWRSIWGLLGMVAFCGVIVSIPWTLPFGFGAVMRLLLWCEVAIGLLGIPYTFWIYSKGRPGLTLGADGFTEWRYPMKCLTVSWSDVDKVEDLSMIRIRSAFGIQIPLQKFFMPSCLTVHLIDSAQTQNALFAYNRSNGFGDVVLSSSMLGISKQELAEMIEKYRSLVQGNP